MIRQFVLGTAMLALVACGGGDASGDEQQETTAELTTPEPAAEGVATALFAFDCGTIEVGDLGVFADDGSYDGQTDTFTDTCFVIRHPKGDLLWDLGLPATLVAEGPTTNPPFTLSLDKELTVQMAEAGLKPAMIDYVAISHSHFDHVGQLEAAGEATWLVHQAEYDYMFSDEAQADYSAFEDFDVKTFTGDYDVFGDGAIRILELPGHTPGHTALLVNMADAGPVMLAGDMFHRTESREGKKVPSFNWDAEETRRSIERFEALAEATGALVIIQHEPEDIAKLPKAPASLK